MLHGKCHVLHKGNESFVKRERDSAHLKTFTVFLCHSATFRNNAAEGLQPPLQRILLQKKKESSFQNIPVLNIVAPKVARITANSGEHLLYARHSARNLTSISSLEPPRGGGAPIISILL